jgi:site-specific recombinase XerD
VGEAVLEYLEKGRPQTSLRHVFLQAIAPYQSLQCGGSLCTIIRYRLQKAGVKPKGHQGAHAFRFARAHSLLSASVPIKAIGDLLGHRSAGSTAVYLKLVTDDLRAIGLELPPGAKHAALPDKEEALLNEFLDQLGYSPENLWAYRSMLRHFQRFASERKRPLAEQTLRSWLKKCAAESKLPYLIDRATFVKRFLDWLVERQMVVPTNYPRIHLCGLTA